MNMALPVSHTLHPGAQAHVLHSECVLLLIQRTASKALRSFRALLSNLSSTRPPRFQRGEGRTRPRHSSPTCARRRARTHMLTRCSSSPSRSRVPQIVRPPAARVEANTMTGGRRPRRASERASQTHNPVRSTWLGRTRNHRGLSRGTQGLLFPPQHTMSSSAQSSTSRRHQACGPMEVRTLRTSGRGSCIIPFGHVRIRSLVRIGHVGQYQWWAPVWLGALWCAETTRTCVGMMRSGASGIPPSRPPPSCGGCVLVLPSGMKVPDSAPDDVLAGMARLAK